MSKIEKFASYFAGGIFILFKRMITGCLGQWLRLAEKFCTRAWPEAEATPFFFGANS
jgi:hypothetical protein